MACRFGPPGEEWPDGRTENKKAADPGFGFRGLGGAGEEMSLYRWAPGADPRETVEHDDIADREQSGGGTLAGAAVRLRMAMDTGSPGCSRLPGPPTMRRRAREDTRRTAQRAGTCSSR